MGGLVCGLEKGVEGEREGVEVVGEGGVGGW